MTSRHSGLKGIRLISILTLILLFPASAFAQGEVANPSEIRDAIRKAAEQKDKNREQVRSFFATPEVSGALSMVGMDFARIEKAVSSLDDETAARLAAQTYKIQKDF